MPTPRDPARRRILAFGLGAMAATARTVRAAAPAAPFSARYVLALGGLTLGEAALTVTEAEGRYEAEARVRSAGAARWFADLAIEAEAAGALAEGPLLAPRAFDAEAAFGEERWHVEMRFEPEVTVTAEPPFRERAYDPPPAALRGALDPLSVAAAAFPPRPLARIGPAVIPVFDGRRRVDIRIAEPRMIAGRLVAEAEMARVAGFKEKHLRLPPHPLTLRWTVEGDLAAFERAMTRTPLGAAVLRRA